MPNLTEAYKKMIESDLSKSDGKDHLEKKITFQENHIFEKSKDSLLLEKIKDLQHYRNLREGYAHKVFKFLLIWCFCVFGLVLSSAILSENIFHLSDNVLITICGGTTISTIGLVSYIVKGLFSNK